MKQVLAIILARGGSKRIPRKNLEKIDEIPLVGHAINHAKKSKYINKIIVSTDDEQIRQTSLDYGAQIIDRPEEYRNDNTVMEADNILCQVVNDLESQGDTIDIVVLLYPTAPLRPVKKVDEAIELVLNQGYDSSLSLIPDQGYYWTIEKGENELKPANYSPSFRVPSVMHKHIQFKENKAIYVCTRDLLIDTKCRLGGKIGYVTMTAMESIDVDEPVDLELSKVIYNFLKK
jgi:CMP-N,N'-diacetyllegionaminic acid synthase